jgi:tetratricopeptide (TPR) repeat protein
MRASFFIALAACVLALVPRAAGGDAAEAQRLLQRAQALGKEEKYTEAIVAMKNAVRLEPRNPDYFAVLSELERRAGRFGDATGHALEAVRLNDQVALYPALVAANAYADQKPDLAREYCQKALRRGEKELGPGPYQDLKTLEGLLAKRTFTIVWELDPQKGAAVGGTLTVAFPKGDLPYQSVTYTVKGARSQQLIRSEANDLLRLVPDGTNPIRITTRITTQPYSYQKRLTGKRTRGFLPHEVRAYLPAVDDMTANSPKVTGIVATLKTKDDLETVQYILAWLKKHVRYKFDGKSVSTLDYKSADEVLERGYAECRGYTVAFVSLCRAAGVPARPVWGLAMLPPTKETPKGDYGSHNWAEVYIGGVGWVPVDPQKPETLGWLPNNNLRIFMFSRRSLTAPETLPMGNLLSMNGPHVKFEESR